MSERRTRVDGSTALQTEGPVGNAVEKIGPRYTGLVISFPQLLTEETVAAEAGTLPVSDLDEAMVHSILGANTDRSAGARALRTANLLAYAWDSQSVLQRRLPPQLLPFMPAKPGEWYLQADNQADIEKLLRPDTHIGKHLIADTEQFRTYSFLYNALRIREIAGGRHEGIRVEYSARRMLQDAAREYAFRESRARQP